MPSASEALPGNTLGHFINGGFDGAQSLISVHHRHPNVGFTGRGSRTCLQGRGHTEAEEFHRRLVELDIKTVVKNIPPGYNPKENIGL